MVFVWVLLVVACGFALLYPRTPTDCRSADRDELDALRRMQQRSDR